MVGLLHPWIRGAWAKLSRIVEGEGDQPHWSKIDMRLS